MVASSMSIKGWFAHLCFECYQACGNSLRRDTNTSVIHQDSPVYFRFLYLHIFLTFCAPFSHRRLKIILTMLWATISHRWCVNLILQVVYAVIAASAVLQHRRSYLLTRRKAEPRVLETVRCCTTVKAMLASTTWHKMANAEQFYVVLGQPLQIVPQRKTNANVWTSLWAPPRAKGTPR